jgi:hypothetical protein
MKQKRLVFLHLSLACLVVIAIPLACTGNGVTTRDDLCGDCSKGFVGNGIACIMVDSCEEPCSRSGNGFLCQSDADCKNQTGTYCHLCEGVGSCYPTCAQAPCPGPAEVCNPQSLRCEPKACQANSDCPTNFECSNKLCQRTACKLDSQCGNGVCIDNLCHEDNARCIQCF